MKQTQSRSSAGLMPKGNVTIVCGKTACFCRIQGSGKKRGTMRFVVGNRNHKDTVYLQTLGCLPRFNITTSNQRSQPKTNDVSKEFIQNYSVNGSALPKWSEQSLRSKIYVFHSKPIQKTTPDHTMRPKNSGSTVPESKIAHISRC